MNEKKDLRTLATVYQAYSENDEHDFVRVFPEPESATRCLKKKIREEIVIQAKKNLELAKRGKWSEIVKLIDEIHEPIDSRYYDFWRIGKTCFSLHIHSEFEFDSQVDEPPTVKKKKEAVSNDKK